MRRLQAFALLSALVLSVPAFAQTNVIDNFRNSSGIPTPVSPANPLPTTATLSASSLDVTVTNTVTSPAVVTCTNCVTGSTSGPFNVTVTNTATSPVVVTALGTAAGTAIAGVNGSPVLHEAVSALQGYSNGQFNWPTMNLSGATLIAPTATPFGGATTFLTIANNTDNARNLKSTPGTLYGVQLSGLGSAPAYLKFYDKATAPTCASDTVVAQYMIPANSTAANGGGNNASFPVGKKFATGISYCVVTGITPGNDTAVPADTFIINIDYN